MVRVRDRVTVMASVGIRVFVRIRIIDRISFRIVLG